MASEQEEWARAARAGRRKKRPLIFGLLAAVIVTVAGYAAIAWTASDMQERADEGEVVYEHRGAKTLLWMMALPVFLGAGAFLLVFRATGGKLAAEYERALRDR
jgi:hypothetical protein